MGVFFFYRCNDLLKITVSKTKAARLGTLSWIFFHTRCPGTTTCIVFSLRDNLELLQKEMLCQSRVSSKHHRKVIRKLLYEYTTTLQLVLVQVFAKWGNRGQRDSDNWMIFTS